MIDFIAVMCIRMVRSLRDENAADEDVGETRHAAKRPRVMSRESASPDGLQHGRFSGTVSSALRPAAVDRPMASAAFWISAEAWPQPVCVVDGDALADTGLLSHASNLLKAYSRADGLEDEKLIQTDLEEDKTVLDAIAAAGQWHADRPPFSSLGELGANCEHKGIGVASTEKGAQTSVHERFGHHIRAVWSGKGKAFWLKLVQLVGEPPETLFPTTLRPVTEQSNAIMEIWVSHVILTVHALRPVHRAHRNPPPQKKRI
jgi:hypothetical protein